MIIHECQNPVPCITPIGEGYIWYITSNGIFENDEFTVVLAANGQVRHFTSDQVKVWYNQTYGIKQESPF